MKRAASIDAARTRERALRGAHAPRSTDDALHSAVLSAASRRAAVAAGVALAIEGCAGVASAEPPTAPTSAPRSRATPTLEFRAGRVELDTLDDTLHLSRGVVIRVERYRLQARELTLRRTPRGVSVDGEGRLSLCPCSEAPVSIGFRSATIAPPTDLLLEQPTLRVGDVPVLWLPALWLRAPDRAGILPPRVEWRGADGLLAGAGAHLPVGAAAEGQLRDVVEFSAAGYALGGVDLEARLLTAQSTNRVHWDWLHRSRLGLDAVGWQDQGPGASAAYRVDAERGARALRAIPSLEAAARRYDRAEVAVTHGTHGQIHGLGMRAAGARGQALGSVGVVGPSAHLAYGGAQAEIGSARGDATVATLAGSQGATSLLGERAVLRLDARPGPLRAGVEAAALARSVTEPTGASTLAASLIDVSVGVPLARAYGARRQLLHVVEPLIELRAGVARGGDPLRLGPVPGGESLALLAGVDNLLGDRSSREAVRASLRGGALGDLGSLSGAAALHLTADSAWFGASGRTTWLVSQRPAGLIDATARFGRIDLVELTVRGTGRLDVDPAAAGWLTPRPLDSPLLRALDLPGWSAGSELWVAWTDWLASSAGVDVDLDPQRLLAARAAVAWRHRCGCLALLGFGARRLGRPGVDLGASIDLAP